MNCRDAQDLLLEAERAELLGEPTTELGRHVATCPACGARARRILDAEAALDRALSHPPARRRRRMPLAAWGGLAAAAVVVLLLLPRQRPADRQAPVGLPNDVAAVSVDVSGGAGTTAVVFQTADPTITVVWFFQD